MRPFKYLLNLMRGRLLFSNILLDSSFSNLFIKKDKKAFKLYSKNKILKKVSKKEIKKYLNIYIKIKLFSLSLKHYFLDQELITIILEVYPLRVMESYL